MLGAHRLNAAREHKALKKAPSLFGNSGNMIQILFGKLSLESETKCKEM
jgi:hypothetical protein